MSAKEPNQFVNRRGFFQEGMHHQASTLLGNSNTVFHPGSHYWDYYNGALSLTHWGRVTHKCVNKLTIIGSYNGLPPDRRQAIIWTNAGILLIGPLGTNFREIFIRIHKFSFKKMHLKMSSGKCWPFCPGISVLSQATATHINIMLS